MRIFTLETGYFKLDGGAMFGVVPKSIWQKSIPADANNMCNWAMRCLLIEDGKRLILIDTGIGDKQDEKFFGYYYLNGDDTLKKSLHQLGFDFSDVTDVFLTHLHFDHCGGAIKRESDKLVPTFPKAKFWSNQAHWRWATEPNAREKASFLKENILPIQESGQLNFVEGTDFEGIFEVFFASGHTESMMCPILNYKGHKIAYCADLLPSHAHLPLAYVMGYDTRPLLTLEEKKIFLDRAADENMILVFEHDAQIQACTLQKTDRGVRMDKPVRISEL
jgi:glyoxylase-like metal-dependent hydrolase (beta-lactamase superfamily II)